MEIEPTKKEPPKMKRMMSIHLSATVDGDVRCIEMEGYTLSGHSIYEANNMTTLMISELLAVIGKLNCIYRRDPSKVEINKFIEERIRKLDPNRVPPDAAKLVTDLMNKIRNSSKDMRYD